MMKPTLTRRRWMLGSGAATAAWLLRPPAGAGASGSSGIRAGAAVADITLPLGASNLGVISRNPPPTHIHDPLYARCLALDDGTTQLAFAICDLRMLDRERSEAARRALAEAVGLPPAQILISATHSHSAPAVLATNLHSDLDRWYYRLVVHRIADGIRTALNRLAPAELGWGVGQVPQHVFNRRWFMRPEAIPANPFGQTGDRVRMNPPGASEDLIEPAGPVDAQVSVLAARHVDGRPLALLANYGLHYVGGFGREEVSADYFGFFARRIRQQLDADSEWPPFVAMMSNGASGDVNNIDFQRPRQSYPPYQRMREVADDVADEVHRVVQGLEYRRDTKLAAAETDLDLGVRRPDRQRRQWADEIWQQVRDGRPRNRPEIYAAEARMLAEYPETVPVKLQALRIGEVGIAAAPCEVFAETGLAIKAESPLQPSFVIELANGYNGYLPTPQQHEWGGYETWPSRGAYLEVDAEPRIRATLLDLLGDVATTV